MEAVVRQYGGDIGRNGMMRCPFHSDKTPSAKVYERAFHCFGCGDHQDAVGYVAKLHGLKPIDAVRKLDADFSLHLDFDADRRAPRHAAAPAQQPQPTAAAMPSRLAQPASVEQTDMRPVFPKEMDDAAWAAAVAEAADHKPKYHDRFYTYADPTDADRVRWQRRDNYLQWEEEAWLIIRLYRHKLECWKKQYAPENPNDDLHPRYAYAVSYLEEAKVFECFYAATPFEARRRYRDVIASMQRIDSLVPEK